MREFEKQYLLYKTLIYLYSLIASYWYMLYNYIIDKTFNWLVMKFQVLLYCLTHDMAWVVTSFLIVAISFASLAYFFYKINFIKSAMCGSLCGLAVLCLGVFTSIAMSPSISSSDLSKVNVVESFLSNPEYTPEQKNTIIDLVNIAKENGKPKQYELDFITLKVSMYERENASLKAENGFMNLPKTQY